MKLVILGQPRTGTTALFTRVVRAFPEDTRTLFEPQTYDSQPEDAMRDVIVKMLVGNLPGDAAPDYASCHNFDHTVVLVRDPRDRLISGLLFLLHWSSATHPPVYNDRAQCPWYLQWLKAKESQPGHLPVSQLFHAVMGRYSEENARSWLDTQQQYFLTMTTQVPSVLLVRYEAMIGMHGDVSALETMLQKRLPLVPVYDTYRSIYRAGTSGFWRHWFVPSDVTYFRPLMQPYLLQYGYDTSWELASPQRIDPWTSSKYVEKWWRIKRRQARVHA